MPIITDKKTDKKRMRRYSELTAAMKKKYPTAKSYQKYLKAYKRGPMSANKKS